MKINASNFCFDLKKRHKSSKLNSKKEGQEEKDKNLMKFEIIISNVLDNE